jgi:hypothetical protein
MYPKDSGLKQDLKQQLLKALEYLDYSYAKIQVLPHQHNQLDMESLEVWESFATRFSRVADIFLSKYVRFLVLADDPGFRGSFRDFMNYAEKLNLIDNIDSWMEIRSLSNMAAHEYAGESLTEYFENLRDYTPKLLSIKNLLMIKD